MGIKKNRKLMPITKLETQISSIVLCSFGIFKNPTHSLIYRIIFGFCSCIGLSGSIFGFLWAIGTANKLEASTALTSQLTPLIVFIIITTRASKILDLFSKLKNKADDADTIVVQSRATMVKKILRYVIAFYIHVVICTMLPTVLSYWKDKFEEKRSLFVPYWLSCEDGSDTGIGNNVLMRLCWKVHNSKELFWKNTFTLIFTGPAMVVYFTCFALYALMVEENVMHFNVIKSQFDRFVEEAQKVDKKFNHARLPIHEKLLNHLFFDIVKHEQFLHSCVKQTIDTMEPFVSFYYFAYFIDATMFLFCMFLEYSQHEVSIVVKMIILSEVRSFMAFVITKYAQTLSELNDDFMAEMDRILWYERSIEFRKKYLQVLTVLQKTNSVKIGGMYELNFAYFLSLLQFMYSTYNLLILKYGRYKF